MKNIAIINCLKATEVCAGVACMEAFNEKKASFTAYDGDKTQLAAFMMCAGCDRDVMTDRGLKSKLDRLEKIGTDTAHFGICTKNQKTGEECENITKIAEMLEKRGIQVIRGTH